MIEPNYKEIAENLYRLFKEDAALKDIPEEYKKLLEPKKRLYRVSVQTDLVVYAESEVEAEKIAIHNRSDEEPENCRVRVIERESELGGWEDCIPYGEEDEHTCKQLFNS